MVQFGPKERMLVPWDYVRLYLWKASYGPLVFLWCWSLSATTHMRHHGCIGTAEHCFPRWPPFIPLQVANVGTRAEKVGFFGVPHFRAHRACALELLSGQAGWEHAGCSVHDCPAVTTMTTMPTPCYSLQTQEHAHKRLGNAVHTPGKCSACKARYLIDWELVANKHGCMVFEGVYTFNSMHLDECKPAYPARYLTVLLWLLMHQWITVGAMLTSMMHLQFDCCIQSNLWKETSTG